jgi:hypothetical protein
MPQQASGLVQLHQALIAVVQKLISDIVHDFAAALNRAQPSVTTTYLFTISNVKELASRLFSL